jgi:hypothetical protein
MTSKGSPRTFGARAETPSNSHDDDMIPRVDSTRGSRSRLLQAGEQEASSWLERGRFRRRAAGKAAKPAGLLAPEMDPARNLGAALL